TASCQRVRRTPTEIAQSTQDYFLVSIQTQGEGFVIQDGRVARLGPGDFALYDSTRPYELSFYSDYQQYVLQIPGPVVRSKLRDPEQLTAQPVRSTHGAGRLVINMIDSLAASSDTLEPSSVAAASEGVENIVVAGLCSLPAATVPTVTN